MLFLKTCAILNKKVYKYGNVSQCDTSHFLYIYCELLSVMMYASHDGRWVLDGFVRALWLSGRNTVSCRYPPADMSPMGSSGAKPHAYHAFSDASRRGGLYVAYLSRLAFLVA